MNIKKLIASAIVLVVIDFVYLSTMSKYFNNLVNKIQGRPIQFKLLGALLCYIFLVGGLNYFIINQNKPLIDAFILGAVIYGVYETTNYAIFDDWNWFPVIADTIWGGILFYLTTKIVRDYF